ncbi:GNAT family N-acetyltransferase [Microbacterium sp. zg.Y1090]|uniref:GNAT family N-acetyltransferase n=1 Tax=Microbacterium TaxID=33882 RepID=UPI00214CFEBB|nr:MULTISPECIES: GNAT family N-acetyltransferase [unclassified Microbacterium]MCR2813663.1 GNAT family N-acetyltransferase [Microbacterium sp. zg.Y1084]MCR2818004.1 GNAT family N-acetyltransferase [Microbacterium sp. zg.Y1090]MDL5488078.1 GNAT family N-acetyltransferase [Microbacterium sp. zg-Y1211]WIM27836.1 GNAT family N-acetyltransferase [Microbacterium sp. zg-Y1090]
MQPVSLRTSRLELSLPTPADADAVTEAAQDPEVPRWTTLPSPYTRTHADDFIALAAQWWEDETELTWAIRHDGQWIGMIGLQHLRPGGDAEIGFWMAAGARGQGYLGEAARAVIDFSFGEALRLQRVEWQAIVGNIPSARTARSLGFRYEGLMRQKLVDPRGRHDGWVAGLLPTDDRTPVDWPILAV